MDFTFVIEKIRKIVSFENKEKVDEVLTQLLNDIYSHGYKDGYDKGFEEAC